MNCYLRPLSENDGREIYDMLQGIEKEDNGFYNDVNGMPYEDYLSWLKANSGYSKSVGLKSWMVPQTTYWLYRGETPVGCGRIRHFLNDNLRAQSGHIGYAISRAYRGKGYGNEILKLLVPECGNLKIAVIQIGANKDNERSNKIILKNGGKLYKETGAKNIYTIAVGSEA